MVQPHLRFAASACVVVAGLSVGVAGAATASADTGSVDSTTSADADVDGTTEPTSTSTADALTPVATPVDEVPAAPTATATATATATLPETIPAVAATVGSGRTPGETTTDSTDAKALTALENLPDLTVSKKSKKDMGDVVTAVNHAVQPVTTLITQLPFALAEPVGVMMATLPGQLAQDPAPLITLIPRLAFEGAQAITEAIIASNRLLLTSAADSITAFAQLPTELSTIFGEAGLAPITTPPPFIDGDGPAATPADVMVPAVALDVPAQQAFIPIPAVPMLSDKPEVTAPAAPAAPVPLVDSSSTVVKSAAVASVWDTPLKVARAIGNTLKSVSVWELALLALPGLFGLTVLTGAGVRVGHLQARAGYALRMSDVARFARTGPLGVVRSSSSTSATRRSLGAHRFLEKAA